MTYTNFRVSCVTCGYDDIPDTYVVRVLEDATTITYCYICAKIAELIETKNQLAEVRNGEHRST